ncbi:MAG: hypothetical protein ACQEUZ_04680 [Pseudomonadota bacterium]
MTAAAPVPSEREIARGAAINGVINAVINGGIQAWLLAGKGPLPLTVDGITNETTTVFGAAAPLAVSLAMILTVVNYLQLKRPRPPFWPAYLGMTLKHGFFALGVLITLAVLWQRIFGSLLVSLPAAVIILGIVAGIAAGTVTFMTIRASLAQAR